MHLFQGFMQYFLIKIAYNTVYSILSTPKIQHHKHQFSYYIPTIRRFQKITCTTFKSQILSNQIFWNRNCKVFLNHF